MTDGDDRERGVLSVADRNYLRNPEEYSRQASHQREREIRKRTQNALLDFMLLLLHLDRDGRRQLLQFETDSGDDLEPSVEAIAGVLGFMYQLSKDTDSDFETWLRWGVRAAQRRDHVSEAMIDLEPIEVTVEVSGGEAISKGELIKKVEGESWDRLTRAELAYLLYLSGRESEEGLLGELADRIGETWELDETG